MVNNCFLQPDTELKGFKMHHTQNKGITKKKQTKKQSLINMTQFNNNNNNKYLKEDTQSTE